MENQPIITTAVFNVSVSKVWDAITVNDEIKKWYFQLAGFNPVQGFKFSFTGGEEGGEQYVHLCEITEVIGKKKLVYSWKYKNYDGFSVVSFELVPQGGKTVLKLTHTGVESFANNGKNFTKESFTKGWDYIIHTSLTNYLQSTS